MNMPCVYLRHPHSQSLSHIASVSCLFDIKKGKVIVHVLPQIKLYRLFRLSVTTDRFLPSLYVSPWQHFVPAWSHPILTAWYMLFNADSERFRERIIFILFNPPLHLYTFPSLQSCRSVPTIAPLPYSLSPCRPLCSLPRHVGRMGGRWHGAKCYVGSMYGKHWYTWLGNIIVDRYPVCSLQITDSWDIHAPIQRYRSCAAYVLYSLPDKTLLKCTIQFDCFA